MRENLIESWFEDFENYEKIKILNENLKNYFSKILEIVPDSKKNSFAKYENDFYEKFFELKEVYFEKTIQIVRKSEEKEKYKEGLFFIYYYSLYMGILKIFEKNDFEISEKNEKKLNFFQVVLFNNILENKSNFVKIENYSKIRLNEKIIKTEEKILKKMDEYYKKSVEIMNLIEYTIEENFVDYEKEIKKIINDI